ncbi:MULTISPECIES: glycosyltransferase [Bacillus]|uniref:TarM n=2 Tax=Bacillus TaxID=1386 RepID=A0A0M4FKX5_9BACI|nr:MULTISPECIES: glycosyltransferase [Bacillus]ALC82529.1 TarM [Bacillus gobiensis]MBP1081433.1 glycosyltransferase involved in cell wall biosynthesis [Bacillus capparidis]MED1096105.1 glycosyltransferase [Bacillus capparidis]
MNKIYSLIYEIDVNKGGITSSMMSRSFLFAEKGYSIDLITLDYKDNYDEIEKKLKKNGRLHPKVNLLNVYQYYQEKHRNYPMSFEQISYYEKSCKADQDGYVVSFKNDTTADYFYNGAYEMQKVWSADGRLLHKVLYNGYSKVRKEEFHIDGYVQRETLFDKNTGFKKVIRYLAPDGFCYLTEWFNDKGNINGVLLFDRDSVHLQKFNNHRDFHTYWLEQLCMKEEDPIIICDGVGSANKVNAMKNGIARRYYCVHSNHLDFPHTYGSPVRENHRYALEHIEDYDGLIVLTEEQKEDIEKDFPSKDNIYVIPHAPRRLHLTEPIDKKKNLFVMIARYHEEKGIDKAIKAMAHLKETHPGIELHIYGSGPNEQEYRKLREQLGADNVQLHGYASDPGTLYSEALATLLTSKFEGFSLAICESFSCATPVISFNVKYSPAELIENGKTGLLVEKDNIEELANSIAFFYENPQLAIECGSLAQEKINDCYNEEILMNRWENVLQLKK